MTAPRLLLIDNYDSFTYNLVQAFLVLGADVLVHRNAPSRWTKRRRWLRRTCAFLPGRARRAMPACRST